MLRGPEGLEEVTSSTMKESRWRPCSGRWRARHRTKKWPVWGLYAVEENRECLLSRGPLAEKERVVGGESLMRLPTATLKEADADELFLHTKPQEWV